MDATLALKRPAFSVLLLVLGPLLAGSVSFRGDGSGIHRGASFPSSRSVRQPLWTAPLDGPSNASPVPFGDLACVLVEPNRVRCFALASGRLAFERRLAIVDTLTEAERLRAEADIDEAGRLRARLKTIVAEQARLRRALRKLRPDPDGPARLARLQSEAESLSSNLTRLARYQEPAVQESLLGFTSATPVTDGHLLYVALGNGVIAALDAAGKVRWTRWLGVPDVAMHGFDHGLSASPVLAAGAVIVGVRRLVALESSTGVERWSTPEPFRDYGTPAVVRIGETEVLLTADGRARRASDGLPLADELGLTWYVGPQVSGREVFWLGSQADEAMQATGARVLSRRLPDRLEGSPLALPVLWESRLPAARYYASPIVTDSHLFALEADGRLHVLSRADGHAVTSLDLSLGISIAYPSLVATDRELLAGSDSGQFVVLELTPPFRIRERLSLGALRSTPTFAGPCLLVRSLRSLSCLAH